MLLELVTGLLMAAAPESASSAEQPAGKPEEKKICRKQIETGSLIKGKKLCYTARQWQQIADNNRQEVERNLQMGSKSGQ
jgi:hypothetical protein